MSCNCLSAGTEYMYKPVSFLFLFTLWLMFLWPLGSFHKCAFHFCYDV